MILVSILATGVAFLAALFYFGFGATRVLLPQDFGEWRALVTPLVGLALIELWDYAALFFGINLATATSALLLVVTGLNAAAVLRGRPLSTLPPAKGESWGFLLSRIAGEGRRADIFRGNRAIEYVGASRWGLALFAFLAAVAPLVRYGYVTIIGENWDYEFYLPLADALRTMSTFAIAQAPANPLINIILSRHIGPLPMGFAYIQTTLDILFRLEAFDSFAILLALIRALGVISPFIFFRATLKMSNRAALVAAALLAFNGLLLWATYWNFGLHLTSLALLPLALAFGADALSRRSGRTSLPMAALFLAALNVTFHPSLIAALLPLGALGLYVLVTHTDRVRRIACGVALLVGTVALSFPTLFHLQDFLREYYGREPLATGLRAFIPITDAYGLSQYSFDLVVGHTIPTPALYDLATRIWNIAAPVLLLLALAASLFALWRLRKDSERRVVWYIIVGASVFYIALFRLPFLRPYPYGFLKSLMTVSFVLLALAVQGAELVIPGSDEGATRNLSSRNQRFFASLRMTTGVAAVLFFALTLFTFGITLEQYFKPAPPFFNADDLKLRELPRVVSQGATVFLSDRAQVQKIPMGLAAYALRDFPLRGNIQTGYGSLDNAEPGAVYAYALLARGEEPLGRGYQPTPLWSNQKFALYPKVEGVIYHQNFRGRASASGSLNFSIGANSVVSGTKPISSTIATRGVSIALATFVPQTATLTIGNLTQTLALARGLSTYTIPEVSVPVSLAINSNTAQDARAESPLLVPWIELREGEGTGNSRIASTNALLIRCASATDLNARCSVANPSGAELRFEWVVRGMPQDTREDQELIRRAAAGSPRESINLSADFRSGIRELQFDDSPSNSFASHRLSDGKYRGALEIFRGDILLARIELYQFAISANSFTHSAPPDPPLVIVQPN